jgi:hypothetical protein
MRQMSSPVVNDTKAGIGSAALISVTSASLLTPPLKESLIE